MQSKAAYLRVMNTMQAGMSKIRLILEQIIPTYTKLLYIYKEKSVSTLFLFHQFYKETVVHRNFYSRNSQVFKWLKFEEGRREEGDFPLVATDTTFILYRNSLNPMHCFRLPLFVSSFRVFFVL